MGSHEARSHTRGGDSGSDDTAPSHRVDDSGDTQLSVGIPGTSDSSAMNVHYPIKGEMKVRQRDLSWEALVDECSASIPAERGKVNAALRDIRQNMSDVEDEMLAKEIRHRARLYRLLWRDIALTPTALAKNWERVNIDASKKAEQGVNLSVISSCERCDGDRFLPRLEPDGREVMVPCPECGPKLSAIIRA